MYFSTLQKLTLNRKIMLAENINHLQSNIVWTYNAIAYQELYTCTTIWIILIMSKIEAHRSATDTSSMIITYTEE